MAVNQTLLNELTAWYRKQDEKPDIRSVEKKIPLLVLLHDLDELSEADRKETFEQFIEDHEVTWGLGSGVSEDFTPWLESWKSIEGSKLTRWERYSQYLTEKGWSYAATEGLDQVTDKLLDLAGSPSAPGEWERKGLAIGEVQSGKTANYIGLLNKALDTGYGILIVLGGHTNDLREQTQIRIDTDLIGYDTTYSNEKVAKTEKVKRSSITGVGLITDSDRFRDLIRPSFLTTREADFNVANRASQGITIGNGPVVAVVKKHAQTITRLATFLRDQSANGRLDTPILVIDDESDWASVNTGDEADIKAVNGAIRSLLNASRRASYLAITATPFANILIDDSNHGDLFPRHYIRALPSPSNYLGVGQYMTLEAQKAHPNRIQTGVEDSLVEIPYAHKKHHRLNRLPRSMEEAIQSFFIGTAVRYQREAGHVPASMMINVSHLNEVQENVHAHVVEYVETMRSALMNENAPHARQLLIQLGERLDEVYPDLEVTLESVRDELRTVSERVHSELINSRTSSQRKRSLSHMTKKERNEYSLRPVIHVGGNVLARGLTLEGLQVSYFLRRTGAADTLLQMGRWFGYRPRYDDLVRVWIDPSIVELFDYSAEISEELREELAQMQALDLTPGDFGLKIRMHPESFRITAANKQKNAAVVTGEVEVFGHVFESTYLPPHGEPADQRNADAAEQLAATLWTKHSDLREQNGDGMTWRDVPAQAIERFFTAFVADSHDVFLGAGEERGSKMLAALGAPGMPQKWDIRFVSGNAGPPFSYLSSKPDVLSVKTSERNTMKEVAEGRHHYIELGNRRLATGGDVLKSMRKEDQDRARRAFKEDFPADKSNGPKEISQTYAVRKGLSTPLLLIYKITANQKKAEPKHYFPDEPLTGAAVAFPGDGEIRRHGVQFLANTVYVRESLGRVYETDTDENGTSYD